MAAEHAAVLVGKSLADGKASADDTEAAKHAMALATKALRAMDELWEDERHCLQTVARQSLLNKHATHEQQETAHCQQLLNKQVAHECQEAVLCRFLLDKRLALEGKAEHATLAQRMAAACTIFLTLHCCRLHAAEHAATMADLALSDEPHCQEAAKRTPTLTAKASANVKEASSRAQDLTNAAMAAMVFVVDTRCQKMAWRHTTPGSDQAQHSANVATLGGQSLSSNNSALGNPNGHVAIPHPPYHIYGRSPFHHGGEPSSDTSCCCTVSLPVNYS